MAVYSMTGYAAAQSGIPGDGEISAPRHAPQAQLGLEIRSVNSRFLDLGFKLPDELRGTEPALRELLGTRLRRGKVELRAWLEGSNEGGLRAPGAHELQKLLNLQNQVLAWLPTAAPLSVAEILQLSARQPGNPGEWHALLLALAQTTLSDLLHARAREGERLCHMLRERLTQLRQLARDAQPLIPQLVAQQRLRFVARWNEALEATAGTTGSALGHSVSSDAAKERALTEATAFAIRIDVAEELTRLDSHLSEIEQLLGQGGEVGKRLDFLIQELHREANTLGSKSSHLELSRIAVAMKVLIEQMREQVQNIE